jgi:hypothetical protein
MLAKLPLAAQAKSRHAAPQEPKETIIVRNAMLTAIKGRLLGRVCLLLVILLQLGQPALAEPERYNGVLRGKNLAPPVETSGLGSVQMALLEDQVSWIVSFYDLKSPPVAVQIHGPAAPGENAGPLMDLGTNWGDLGRNNIMAGKAQIDPDQRASLSSGKWYLIVSTQAHPEGELRAQIQPFK